MTSDDVPGTDVTADPSPRRINPGRHTTNLVNDRRVRAEDLSAVYWVCDKTQGRMIHEINKYPLLSTLPEIRVVKISKCFRSFP